MKIKSPAKINLFLKVVCQRPDGYHEIETLFFPVENPGDSISISEVSREQPEIISSSSAIPCNESNLCFKAAMAFAKFANINPGWQIMIEKNIPVAAGLGGGSSNAAAVLKGLSRLYPVISPADLQQIAVSLGADVPFFLDPVPSIARGIGEKLYPISDMPEIPLVIVNPKFPVSAAWGYKNSSFGNDDANIEKAIEAVKTKNWCQFRSFFRNDLQDAVFSKFPIMNLLHESLIDAGADFAGMSGSGPTLFAICQDQEKASLVARKIYNTFNDSILCFVN